MILADKIIEERKKMGWSQEELAEQLDVSRQSVSKWESAQSIPDINRILKMAQLFGVSTDYLLKDDAVRETAPVSEEPVLKSNPDVRLVSMEEASEYLSLKEKQAPVIACGVFLCVLSAAPLMFLTGVSCGFSGQTADVFTVAGTAILLVLVAAAVYLFIQSGREAGKYEYLEKVEIETAYGVDGMVKEKAAGFAGKYTSAVAIGVVLCIVSAIPLILASVITEDEAVVTAMVGLLLIMVAIAVYLFVSTGIIKESYDILLQEGDYTVNRKKNAPVLRRVSIIYWLLATALYLAISLLGNSWDTSWILWPVAAILFGVVIVITKMVIRAED